MFGGDSVIHNVKFYKCTADKKVANKQPALTLIQDYGNTITLLEGSSIEEPYFRLDPKAIDNHIADTNYFYIGDFKRYYFITEKYLGNGGLLYIRGKSDPLFSNYSDIINLNAFIERQEKVYDANLHDSLLPISERTNYRVLSFGTVPSEYKFYVTTTGGVN